MGNCCGNESLEIPLLATDEEHEEFKVNSLPKPAEQKVSGHSRTFLENVAGFLASKQAVDATALAVLPQRYMERHAPFTNQDGMRQTSAEGAPLRSLEALFATARLALPIFANIVRRIVTASQLDPEEEVKVDNKPLMLDHHTVFKVLSLAPLKGRDRCVEKVANEYGGDCSKLVDVVRCSIVVYTEDQLEAVAQALTPDQAHNGYTVVRLKNRFKSPLFNGYRDALYSISVECGNGVSHVCEVQLHLAAVVAHKETSHKYYEYFRAYFAGSGAEEKRMDVLSCMRDFDRDVDHMVESVLNGCELDQLHALADLSGPGLMGDVHLTARVRKRILDLEQTWQAKADLAGAFMQQGMFREAEPLFREALSESKQKLGGMDLIVSNNFAMLLQCEGKLEEAELLYCEMLAEKKKLLGDTHPSTLTSVSNLAALLEAQGKYEEAELLSREALSGSRKQLGDSDPDTLTSMSNLGELLRAQGKFGEADTLVREALAERKKHLGEAHPDTLTSIANLGCLLEEQGQHEEAERLFREALSRRTEILGVAHPHTLLLMHNLAGFLQDQDRLGEAEPLYRTVLGERRRQLGDSHPDTLQSITDLGFLLQARSEFREAERLYREAVAEYSQQLGKAHPSTIAAMQNLVGILFGQGKQSEAQCLYAAFSSGD